MAVGAVVSAPAGMVTVVDCGEPISVVWASPDVSAIEKVPEAVSVETLAPPPAVAEEVALIVHTFADV